MFLGVHCSIRHGFGPALEEARALGCDAMQIFPYRRHAPPTAEELAAFRRARAASPVKRLLIHSRYLPTLGSSDERRRRASVEHLRRELALSAGLGADAFVFHAGAYSPGSSAEEGLALCVRSFKEAAEGLEAGPALLIENVAGGGRRMGGTPGEVRELVQGLRQAWPEVGVCFDTAHAWSAGEDLRAPEAARRALADYGGSDVRALHLNDTTADFGSRKENHCDWGAGRLGSEGLAALLSAPELDGAAAILETPKGGDRRNLDFVRGLTARP